MDLIEQEFSVAFRYPVHFTRGVFDPANPLFHRVVVGASPRLPADMVVVVDDGVARAHRGLIDHIQAYAGRHADGLKLTSAVLVVPGGEEAKNAPRHLESISRTIHDGALCRHSYVVAIGGGALLDVVGYAAATAHRGIRLVRVPTTVLAQDDSGVGVKNGINAFGKKNYFGTFAPPFAVINDFNFLSTLLDRDWLCGVSEAIKAALIKDAGFFDQLEREAPRLVARDADAMEETVRRSAALHLAHISAGGDPFELTSSRPLDFGHWAAHKLEQLSHNRIRHGEAVGVGIALDSTYAWIMGALPEEQWRRIIELLIGLRLSVFVPELAEALDDPDHPRSLFRGLPEFREHLGGELTVMLLRAIGEPFDVHEISPRAMIRSIDILRQVESARTTRAVDPPFAAPLSRGPS